MHGSRLCASSLCDTAPKRVITKKKHLSHSSHGVPSSTRAITIFSWTFPIRRVNCVQYPSPDCSTSYGDVVADDLGLHAQSTGIYISASVVFASASLIFFGVVVRVMGGRSPRGASTNYFAQTWLWQQLRRRPSVAVVPASIAADKSARHHAGSECGSYSSVADGVGVGFDGGDDGVSGRGDKLIGNRMRLGNILSPDGAIVNGNRNGSSKAGMTTRNHLLSSLSRWIRRSDSLERTHSRGIGATSAGDSEGGSYSSRGHVLSRGEASAVASFQFPGSSSCSSSPRSPSSLMSSSSQVSDAPFVPEEGDENVSTPRRDGLDATTKVTAENLAQGAETRKPRLGTNRGAQPWWVRDKDAPIAAGEASRVGEGSVVGAGSGPPCKATIHGVHHVADGSNAGDFSLLPAPGEVSLLERASPGLVPVPQAQESLPSTLAGPSVTAPVGPGSVGSVPAWESEVEGIATVGAVEMEATRLHDIVPARFRGCGTSNVPDDDATEVGPEAAVPAVADAHRGDVPVTRGQSLPGVRLPGGGMRVNLFGGAKSLSALGNSMAKTFSRKGVDSGPPEWPARPKRKREPQGDLLSGRPPDDDDGCGDKVKAGASEILLGDIVDASYDNAGKTDGGHELSRENVVQWQQEQQEQQEYQPQPQPSSQAQVHQRQRHHRRHHRRHTHVFITNATNAHRGASFKPLLITSQPLMPIPEQRQIPGLHEMRPHQQHRQRSTGARHRGGDPRFLLSQSTSMPDLRSRVTPKQTWQAGGPAAYLPPTMLGNEEEGKESGASDVQEDGADGPRGRWGALAIADRNESRLKQGGARSANG